MAQLTRLTLLAALLLGGCDDPQPPWCAAEGELTLPCSGPGCIGAVLVDYRRLEPRGFKVQQVSPGTPVTQQEAESIGLDHVTQVEGAPLPTRVDSDRAGAYYICFLGYDNSDTWLVIVHAASAQVVFAGLEIWANPERGADPPLPAGWQPPALLGCSDSAGAPVAQAFRTTGIPTGSAPASTAQEALEVVQRLNLTAAIADGGAYEAMVVSHSQAVGEFDPWSADWLVWITTP